MCCRWFCHVDDDNYLNIVSLLKLLSQYSHMQDVYIGRPSLERPIEATEKLGTSEMVHFLLFALYGGRIVMVARNECDIMKCKGSICYKIIIVLQSFHG